MAREKVSQMTIDVALASFERCCELPDFFDSFYRHLFDSRPQVESMFRNTDFERQHSLLRHAIGLLLDFPSVPPDEEPNILTRLADVHGRRQIDALRGFATDSETQEKVRSAVKLGVTAFTLEWDGHVQAMTGQREFWMGTSPLKMRQPKVRLPEMPAYR